MKYIVGDLQIDTGTQAVTRGSAPLALPKLSYDLLLVLVRAAPNLVSLDQMMEEVWPGLVVSPETVSKRVTLLRDALGDDSKAPRYIAGLRGRGYQIVAPVSEPPPPIAAPPMASRASSSTNETRAPPLQAAELPISPQPVLEPATIGHSRPRARHLYLYVLCAALVLGAVVAAYIVPVMKSHRRAPSLTSQSARAPSIAVLPFDDMSESHDQDFLGDGIAEEIIDVLAQVPSLKVIGRTSSFQFKGRNVDLRSIGTELGANYIVEGSVRRAGDRVRITAQLIDASDGSHLWSQSLDRPANDVLTVEEGIARAVARSLQIGADPGEPLGLRITVTNPQAYQLYLKGRYDAAKDDREGFELAAEEFSEALKLDPSFADAASWLSAMYKAQTEWGYVPPDQGYARAKIATEHALTLNPRDARLYAQLAGICRDYDWQWSTCDKYMRKARALAPRSPDVLRYAANLEQARGQWDEAQRDIQSSLSVDPLNPISWEVLGQIDYRTSRMQEAESAARKTLAISPRYGWGHYFLGRILIVEGQVAAAQSEFEQEPEEGLRKIGLALAGIAAGKKQQIAPMVESLGQRFGVEYACELAELYAFEGDADHAVAWLERAYSQKDIEFYRIRGNPLLTIVETNVRYQSLMRKMN